MVKYDDVIHTSSIRSLHAEQEGLGASYSGSHWGVRKDFSPFLKLSVLFFESNLILEKLRCILYSPVRRFKCFFL